MPIQLVKIVLKVEILEESNAVLIAVKSDPCTLTGFKLIEKTGLIRHLTLKFRVPFTPRQPVQPQSEEDINGILARLAESTGTPVDPTWYIEKRKNKIHDIYLDGAIKIGELIDAATEYLTPIMLRHGEIDYRFVVSVTDDFNIRPTRETSLHTYAKQVDDQWFARIESDHAVTAERFRQAKAGDFIDIDTCLVSTEQAFSLVFSDHMRTARQFKLNKVNGVPAEFTAKQPIMQLEDRAALKQVLFDTIFKFYADVEAHGNVECPVTREDLTFESKVLFILCADPENGALSAFFCIDNPENMNYFRRSRIGVYHGKIIAISQGTVEEFREKFGRSLNFDKTNNTNDRRPSP
jgi:hypothetical protein